MYELPNTRSGTYSHPSGFRRPFAPTTRFRVISRSLACRFYLYFHFYWFFFFVFPHRNFPRHVAVRRSRILPGDELQLRGRSRERRCSCCRHNVPPSPLAPPGQPRVVFATSHRRRSSLAGMVKVQQRRDFRCRHLESWVQLLVSTRCTYYNYYYILDVLSTSETCRAKEWLSIKYIIS